MIIVTLPLALPPCMAAQHRKGTDNSQKTQATSSFTAVIPKRASAALALLFSSLFLMHCK